MCHKLFLICFLLAFVIGCSSSTSVNVTQTPNETKSTDQAATQQKTAEPPPPPPPTAFAAAPNETQEKPVNKYFGPS